MDVITVARSARNRSNRQIDDERYSAGFAAYYAGRTLRCNATCAYSDGWYAAAEQRFADVQHEAAMLMHGELESELARLGVDYGTANPAIDCAISDRDAIFRDDCRRERAIRVCAKTILPLLRALDDDAGYNAVRMVLAKQWEEEIYGNEG